MVLHDLYVIYNEGGRCIHHYKFGGLNVNSELVGSFLDALSTFAMETIPSKGQMRLVDRGNVKILFEQGKYVTLALFASDDTPETRGPLSLFLSRFESNYSDVLKGWDGSLTAFEGLDNLIRSIFKRERVSQEKMSEESIPKPIPLVEVTGSRMKAKDALSIIRAAVKDSVSGVLSITFNQNKIEPIGYVSILRGKGYAAVYTKPGSKIRRGTDAARHIIFDSVTLPAWVRFRAAQNGEIDTDIDRTINRIDTPLNKIILDTLLLRHYYDEIKNMKPKSKQIFSSDDRHHIVGKFGDSGVNVLRTSQGRITLEQLATLHGLSPLEVTEILVWAGENGLIEMVKS
jgi:spore coat protein CotH